MTNSLSLSLSLSRLYKPHTDVAWHFASSKEARYAFSQLNDNPPRNARVSFLIRAQSVRPPNKLYERTCTRKWASIVYVHILESQSDPKCPSVSLSLSLNDILACYTYIKRLFSTHIYDQSVCEILGSDKQHSQWLWTAADWSWAVAEESMSL